MRRTRAAATAVMTGWLGFAAPATAATIDWKGHTWQVTSGAMAGVCQGAPANVSVDSNGYLHLRIANSGGAWTASELFTTDQLGFGTYQWQVDGPIDVYDKNVVLGLFPYGPAAGVDPDGTNEIDIEYARWGQANGPNGDWTDYPASGSTIGELSYTFSLGGGTLSTSRFTWSSTSIADALLGGLQPVDGEADLIESWTYAPTDPATDIPQHPLPLGMNLWCFDAPPSDGNPVEIVIRDFTFVPASGTGGAAGGGGAGATGSAGSGGAGGSPGAAGSGGAAGNPGLGGAAGSGASGGTQSSGGADGGATGQAGAPGGSAGAGGAPSGTTGGASSGCGCALGAPPTAPSALAGVLLAAMFAALRGRRRSAGHRPARTGRRRSSASPSGSAGARHGCPR